MSSWCPRKPEPKPAAGTAPAIYRNMSINVSIESVGNVWLNDPMGKMELAANLKAKKEPGRNLALGGEIRSLRGTLDIQDRTFTVERAALLLPGVAGKPLTWTSRPSIAMDDITLAVNVTGTLANPQIRLESLPPLPPADVLSYLVFGAPAATLSRDQYLALGAQTAGGPGRHHLQEDRRNPGVHHPLLKRHQAEERHGGPDGPRWASARKSSKMSASSSGAISTRNAGCMNGKWGSNTKSTRSEHRVPDRPRNTGADVFFNYDF